MNWGDILQIFDIGTRIIGALGLVAFWALRGTMMTRASFALWLENFEERWKSRNNEIDHRFAKGDGKFIEFGTDGKHRPTQKDIADIRRDLGLLSQNVAELSAE